LSVTPRKLQRLGLSSLVVTLPRRWVEAHGLKPGDLVYVIDEGDRLRIVPAQPSEARRSYRFDAYKLAMPQLASAALTCLYVNNINDVIVDLKGMGEEGLKQLKQTSMRLLGLEVTQLDSERASVRIVLDDSRADPKMAIKGLGSAVGNIAELLRRASSGEALGSDEVEVATAELLKYQHLIMRHVVSSVSEGVIDTRVQGTIVGTAVLGVVGNVLLEALKACPEVVPQVEQGGRGGGPAEGPDTHGKRYGGAAEREEAPRGLPHGPLALRLAGGPAGLKPGPEGGGCAVKGRRRREGPDDSLLCNTVLGGAQRGLPSRRGRLERGLGSLGLRAPCLVTRAVNGLRARTKVIGKLWGTRGT